MRFLADENFPLDAVEALRQKGHDVAWIRTESPGISDPEVLRCAQIENGEKTRASVIAENLLAACLFQSIRLKL